MIENEYEINQQTLAIIPAKQIDFDSIVIETKNTRHIKKTALQLIKTACYNDWTTYEGRRQAVMHHTNYIQKVPIPISMHNRIYFFPTHSPSNIDNSWIAYQHIAHIEKSPENTQKPTIIYFKTGQAMSVDISIHTLRSQIQRTATCIYKMENMLGRSVK